MFEDILQKKVEGIRALYPSYYLPSKLAIRFHKAFFNLRLLI